MLTKQGLASSTATQERQWGSWQSAGWLLGHQPPSDNHWFTWRCTDLERPWTIWPSPPLSLLEPTQHTKALHVWETINRWTEWRWECSTHLPVWHQLTRGRDGGGGSCQKAQHREQPGWQPVLRCECMCEVVWPLPTTADVSVLRMKLVYQRSRESVLMRAQWKEDSVLCWEAATLGSPEQMLCKCWWQEWTAVALSSTSLPVSVTYSAPAVL